MHTNCLHTRYVHVVYICITYICTLHLYTLHLYTLHTCAFHVYTLPKRCIHTCWIHHVHIYIYICYTRKYIYIYTHTHTYTHICVHAFFHPSSLMAFCITHQIMAIIQNAWRYTLLPDTLNNIQNRHITAYYAHEALVYNHSLERHILTYGHSVISLSFNTHVHLRF